MIDSDSLRSYHRQLALHLLQTDAALTASEVHEAMTSVALAEGHPRECAAITPAAVAGMLRGMHGEGAVVQGADKKNPRYGRAEPTWAAVPTSAAVERPGAPGTRPVAPAFGPAPGAPSPYQQITVDQRLAFLQLESRALLTDIARDHAAFEQRVRTQLTAFEARVQRMLGLAEDTHA